jgi:uncharacterized membrane protein
MDTRRAESFSDGVFAVAITLLIFNLLPIADHALTYHALLAKAWPQYAAYAIGFLTIGIMWLNHHTLLAHVAQVDRVMLILNVFLLMFVVAVPFGTALVANNLTGPPASGRVAAVAYGALMILMSLGFTAMWQYLSHRQEKLASGPLGLNWPVTLRFSGGLVGYIVATVIGGLWSADTALIIYGAVGLYYLFEHLPAPAGDADGDTADATDG